MLIQSLAHIYIEEKYLDRLLALVQQENELEITLTSHNHLAKIYPDELLEIYILTLEKYGKQANGRKEYTYLVSKMKRIINDIPVGKEKVIALPVKLKKRFSGNRGRPAMVEELDKLMNPGKLF